MNNKFLIIISFIFLVSFSFTANVFATTVDEVKVQINDINNQIKALDAQIAQYQSQIDETGQQKDTLNNAIKELNLTRNQLLVEKNQIQSKINVTNLVIKEIGNNIETKQESIDKSESSLKEMMYSLYQTEKVSFIERVLSKENLTEVSKEYNNTISINENTKNHIKELLGEKQDLADTKNQKLKEQDKLNTLKNTLVAKETIVLNTKKEKDTLLVQTKNQEAEYQKMLAEQIKKRDVFEKSLENYESQLKFILNPKLLPKAGTGALAWPLDYVFITQLFGVTSSSGRLYASGSHSGVDFRASVGTEVKAMSEGTILGTGDTDMYCSRASFGKWVFIKYDNGLSSIFGHLSVIMSQTGQKVKAGDIVALSGNTGHSTGPHVHVSVYASDGVKIDSVPSIRCSGKSFIMPIAASSSYLDPMLYLPTPTKDQIKPGA
jgi:murein DD-endopeptidase MepM/ murein hydrolase activator NlpD